MDAKTSDWRPGPSVCRCCLTEGCYKDISTEYFWMGKKEVYSEMLSDTFSISIAYSQSGGPNSNSRLICEPCIARLRDASDFRRQVLECEKTFMHHLDPGSSSVAELEIQPETMECEVKLERVKLEKRISDDDMDDRDFLDDDDDDDDLDDEPLTKLASKVPKKESVDLLDLLDNSKLTLKRKSAAKAKASAPKKAKTKKEPAKPAPSKVKPEKKKKDLEPHGMAKRNAEVVLQYSTVYPFRLKGNRLLCVYCCEEYTNPEEFRQHIDESHKKFTVSTAFAHTGKGKELLKVDCINLRCRICSETFENIQDVANHLQDSHEIKRLNLDYSIGMQPYRLEKDKWICFICHIKLPSLTKLCRHTTSHYLGHTCDVCGRAYLTVDALRYHIRCSHSGNHVCRKCWQDFPSLEKKRDHVKVSKKCWPFACIYCGDRFLSWEQKQKHLVEIHGLPRSQYPCPDCSKVYQSRKHFYNHYKLTHTDENFVCTCCGLKFTSKNYLDDHKVGHTGEKLFKCLVCNKKFTRNKSLIQHMWLHSETKRFGCTICQKQFAQKVSMKSHMKSHHPDVPFEC